LAVVTANLLVLQPARRVPGRSAAQLFFLVVKSS
jgi:hypothetical protein